ncbi:MAG: molecular chaperone HtpG, partial [Flavobacteriales bacterium]
MQQGQINVQTENIFPIIKQFLYSDQEIFLRELVSNAVDATQKRKMLAQLGEIAEITDTPQVEVLLDEEAGTMTIRDAGIGMTEEEIDKYINQIAFSGATDFLEKYKDTDAKQAIIGHFGLGFYSAFMVADRVDIVTLSQREGSKAVKWSCDGSPNFSLEDVDKAHAGTDIVLHVSEDAKEYLAQERIREILNTYCKFMPVEIVQGTKSEYVDDPEGAKDDEGNVKKVSVDVPFVVNKTEPAWTKKPADLQDEDYAEFYRDLYPMNFEDPLFHIHLNVDFPFNLTGILYFPKLKKQMDLQKNRIHLYSNQVFITDNVENIVPDFLTLLHGVIDSPDIPLNVSRSYLQEDANVKKISGHISKKVSDKLAQMFKKDRPAFEAQWDDLRVFVEYGMLTDEKFAERAQKFFLY